MLSTQNVNQNRRIFRDKKNSKDYVKGKLLGTGGFAKCYQAISEEEDKLYAAKVIPKKSINEKRQRYKLLIEIKIHKNLKHKHIVEFVDAFEDKENIYILLEYCRNYTLKDLAKRRKRLTQYETRMYISQVVKALIYIHSQNVIHRDLKLGNILINDQMDVKICDFGLSTKIKNEGDSKKTICGTPNYIAPQILEEQGHSYEVDIWSIGVIMYALMFGKPPFEDNTVEQTYENIKNNRYVFPTNIQMSHAAKDLINKILVTDPSKRLSLQEILDHEFMQFPQGIPNSLPVSSLAVPPMVSEKMLPTRLNLHDMQLEVSEDNQEQQDTLDERMKSKQIKQPQEEAFIYIRQIFKFQNTFGYLLSNGIVGCLDKKTQENFVLEFGEEFYYTIKKNQKPVKCQAPGEIDSQGLLSRLFHFKSFFIKKYSIFKIDQMRKRTKETQKIFYLKKASCINQKQVVTRLSNNIIQLHFNDLTSLAIDREDERGIFYVKKTGIIESVKYNQCKSNKIKVKVRRFSNLIQKLSPKEETELEDDNEEEQKEEEQEQQNDENEVSHEFLDEEDQG